jgi:hypothetical protein
MTHTAFFLDFRPQGNPATSGCCSKCWRDAQKKKNVEAVSPRPEPEKSEPLSVDEPMADAKPAVVEPKETEEVKTEVEEQPAAASPAKKKGNSKKSYKAMMAGMMVSSPSRDIEKEKEALRKVTGGGAFSKIDKI